MATTEPRTRRWTKREYYEAAENGWFEGQRVQLIEGEVVEMAPQGHAHTRAVHLIQESLRLAFGPKHWVRTQAPLEVTADSEPEPDVAVAERSLQEYKDHPATALLVVEVADTSLRLDRRKAGLYAAAGVPEYWILDLNARRLEIYRSPLPDSAAEFGHAYSETRTLGENESIAPLARPDHPIRIGELLS